MKKWLVLIIILICCSVSINAYAHSGRTDSSGGHNCSAKSVAKGLCTGYHFHNGGGSSTPPKSTNSTPTPAPKEQKPVYNPQVHYDKGYDAGFSKGREIGYKKGEKDMESTDSNEDFTKGWTAGFKAGYAEGLSKKEVEEKQEKDKKDGASKGKEDGFTAYKDGKEKKAYTYKEGSSDVYKKAYQAAFIISWEEVESEENCFEEGYNQGLKQDEVVISESCDQETLRTKFEEGHEKGVKERDEKEIDKLTKQGETLGYEVAELIIPKEATKESYKVAFEKGYDQGMVKREVEVKKEGYDSAFKHMDFVNEVYTDNEVLSAWYEEGYAENEIAAKIKNQAQSLGEESDEYVISEEYKVNNDSVVLYDSLFYKGQEIKEQREKEQRNTMLSIAAIATPAAGGLYFWNRKRKKVV